MQPMNHCHWVRVTRWLFALNALIWLAFGRISLYRLANAGYAQTAWVVAVLMFGNVAALALCAIGLAKPCRIFYIFALAVLAGNILLTFTDQFGLFAMLTLLLDLVLLVLLIRLRACYLQPGAPALT